jgi:CheY-like chemotaxis protein
MNFRLLQAQHIGLAFPHPIERFFRQCSSKAVDVPGDYLHETTLMVNFDTNMDANLKCILCVEDEPEMIDLIRLILGRRGFEVKGAAGGREGLKMIRQEMPDLVLLDLMMPDMDGWEVYQQMKADDKTKSIPVIVVTAKAQSIDRVLGLHIAKVDDYIAKPFSPQDLMNSVEKVLKSRT